MKVGNIPSHSSHIGLFRFLSGQHTASKYFMLPPFTINGDFIPDNIEFLKRLIGNNLHKAGNKNSIFHCSRVTGDIETWDMRHRDRVRGQWQWTLCWAGLGWVASISAANRSIGSTTGCTITEKAHTGDFSWLTVPTSAFTLKTLLRHYAKQALTPRSLNVKLGPRRNYHKGRAAIRHYDNQHARPLWLFYLPWGQCQFTIVS